MKLDSVMVIASEVNSEDEGGGISITLWTDNGDTARVLAGLIGKEIEIDIEKTISNQPDPQVIHLVEPAAKKKKPRAPKEPNSAVGDPKRGSKSPPTE